MNIAIVTGASSGMGREFALQLSGYVTVDEIWVIARRAEALESLKDEVPVPVRPLSLDLLDEKSFDALETLLAEEKPNIRLLVNAAGFGKFGSYNKVSIRDDCRMIDLNCKALLMMTRLALPYMQSGSHHIGSFVQPVKVLHLMGAGLKGVVKKFCFDPAGVHGHHADAGLFQLCIHGAAVAEDKGFGSAVGGDKGDRLECGKTVQLQNMAALCHIGQSQPGHGHQRLAV